MRNFFRNLLIHKEKLAIRKPMTEKTSKHYIKELAIMLKNLQEAQLADHEVILDLVKGQSEAEKLISILASAVSQQNHKISTSNKKSDNL